MLVFGQPGLEDRDRTQPGHRPRHRRSGAAAWCQAGRGPEACSYAARRDWIVRQAIVSGGRSGLGLITGMTGMG